MNWEQVKQVIDEVKKQTAAEAFSIKIVPNLCPEICDSKFGGVPYWDMQMPYPTDSNGDKLMMLAQINLDKLERSQRLPEKGMLQFFIGLDDVFGLDFDNADVQNSFRVVYHKEVDYSVTKEQVLSLKPPISTSPETEEFTPLYKECALDIKKTVVYKGEGDFSYNELFANIAADKLGVQIDADKIYNEIGQGNYCKMTEEISNEGHWLLGYPYFTQTDPRAYIEKYRYYDTMLFQMDSDMMDKEDYILWGDCGVANFFINHEDLERKDFSKILYNWDCC